jgi:hypothetical protein
MNPTGGFMCEILLCVAGKSLQEFAQKPDEKLSFIRRRGVKQEGKSDCQAV